MTTKQKPQTHTPGPWTARTQAVESYGKKGKEYIVAAPSGIAGEFAPKFFPVAQTNSEANARLIAAAPELLEAAKLALQQHGERKGEPCPCIGCYHCRAAIAKATEQDASRWT